MDVNVIRQEDGDIFNSSSNINCSIYNAKQISPSKCQCVFYGKFVNKKVFGSLYENAFGYSRCFYDKGASLGCYSLDAHLQRQTLSSIKPGNSSVNNTFSARLIFDASKYSSFTVIDNQNWKSDGNKLQLRTNNVSYFGKAYFLKLKLRGKDGNEDRALCAFVKIPNTAPITVALISPKEKVMYMVRKNGKDVYFYSLVGVGVAFVLLVLLLTIIIRKNVSDGRRERTISKTALITKCPLGTASQYCKAASMHVLSKKRHAEDQEEVYINGRSITNLPLTYEEDEQQTLSTSNKTVSTQTAMLPLRHSLLENAVPENKTVGKDKETQTEGLGLDNEENIYEVTEDDFDRYMSSQSLNSVFHKNITNDDYAPPGDFLEFQSTKLTGRSLYGKKDGYAMATLNTTDEDPYVKMVFEPYLSPLEAYYCNLGEHAKFDGNVDCSKCDKICV